MTWQTYPTTPKPSYDLGYTEQFKTLTSEFEGENQQDQGLVRFPKRGFTLPYKLIKIDTQWYLLENFFHRRRGGGEAFWFFDFQQRKWVDEYVGRGGPFYVDGAIADDGGVQTDETLYAVESTASDMTLLPAVPAQDDAYYFGKMFMFDKLTLTITTSGVGTWTITWEFWNGTAWTALAGVTDSTNGLKITNDVTWTMPSTWVDCTVKNRNLYWVRARVSAYTSITTQPKGDYAQVNTQTYDLPSLATVNDASLIVYVNDVITAKSFVSGGGGGGADRVTFGGYQTTGTLITADFTGNLRIKAKMGDSFSDKLPFLNLAQVDTITIREFGR